MLRKAKDLHGYAIAASDGELGKVHDIYFDDDDWIVRYVVVDTGGWLDGRLVLISPHAVTAANGEEKQLAVALTKEQVKESPGIETDLPFERQQEMKYRDYFGWPPYWSGVITPMPLLTEPGVAGAKREQQVPAESQTMTHLRSANAVSGYSIAANDGHIGHVEDFLIDDEAWSIRYLEVDTRNWLPGKRVLVAPDWVESVDWAQSAVVVKLTKDQIQSAPEYDDKTPVHREYEARLHDHYGVRSYWV
jgi:sporulation protein YlmC with PRC-barrel domain